MIALVIGIAATLIMLFVAPFMLWGEAGAGRGLLLTFLVAGPFALLPSALLALWRPVAASRLCMLCIFVLVVDLAAQLFIVEARLATHPNIGEEFVGLFFCYALPSIVPHAGFIWLFKKCKP